MNIDPRAYSPAKLPARAPLPMISRKALRRVKDRIDPPTHCPCCGKEVELVDNSELYGRSYGQWPYMYICFPCDTYVGTHKFTDLPLGTMADKLTREWRKKAKGPFMDRVRDVHKGDRNSAYQELAQLLGIAKEECHFGFFTTDLCQQAFTRLQELK